MTVGTGHAAEILWQNWQRGTRIDELPLDCRPRDRAAGYAVQNDLVRLSGQDIVGWKIAATSTAGQQHIGVDGPLAGPLLANRVRADGAAVPLAGNIMLVAEAEFAFRFAQSLPRRANRYTQDEVLAAVESLHPAIEVPDSRYNDFARVGAPQLIADAACACWFVLGPPATVEWRRRDRAPTERYRRSRDLLSQCSGASECVRRTAETAAEQSEVARKDTLRHFWTRPRRSSARTR